MKLKKASQKTCKQILITSLFCLGLLVSPVKNYAQSPNLSETFSETVYVHIPSNTNVPGGEINFKAYILRRINKLDSLSNPLFVYLLDDKGNTVNATMINTEGNTATGTLKIPQTTSNSLYYLVAYTALMKTQKQPRVFYYPVAVSSNLNNRPELCAKFSQEAYYSGDKLNIDIQFFKDNINILQNVSYKLYSGDKKLSSGTLKLNNEKLNFEWNVDQIYEHPLTLDLKIKVDKKQYEYALNLPVLNKDIAVDFYPESGQLIANTMNKVVFTVKDIHGNGYNLEGKITGSDSKPMLCKTLATGIGFISLKPDLSTNYVFETDLGKFSLPNAIESNVALSYKGKKENEYLFNIQCEQSGEYNIIVSNNFGEILKQKITLSEQSSFKVPAESLPEGSIKIAVTDNSNNELNSLWFIANNAENKSLTMEPQDMSLILNSHSNSSSVIGNLSISAYNTNCRIFPEFASMTPENIRQIISKYINEKGSATAANFYLQTLQGKLTDYVEPLNKGNLIFYPGLEGKVLARDKNKNQFNVKVLNMDNLQITALVTDSSGNFLFPYEETPLTLSSLNVQAFNATGKKSYATQWNNEFNNKVVEAILKNKDYEMEKTQWKLALHNPNLFDVKKASEKFEEQNAYNRELYSTYSNTLDVIKSIKNYTIVDNQIVFRGEVSSINYQTGALIVIDGMKMGTDISALQTVSPWDIENINISTKATDIHKYTGLNLHGIIEIKTLTGKAPDKPELEKTPTPSNTSKNYTWIPELNTDKPTIKVSIPYSGNYKGTVSGFCPDGSFVVKSW